MSIDNDDDWSEMDDIQPNGNDEDQDLQDDDDNKGADDLDDDGRAKAPDNSGLFKGDEIIDEDDKDTKKDDDEEEEGDDEDKGDDKGDDDDDDNIEMSAIEQYLTEFDIEGGMISFDDDTTIHFDELDPTKQVEILQTLQKKQIDDTIERFGLDPKETEIINNGRDHAMGLDGYIDTLVKERLSNATADEVDFKIAPADAIMFKALTGKDPEASKEVIEAKIAGLKENEDLYKDQVDFFRDKFTSEQDTKIASELAEQAKEVEAKLNDERALITNTAQEIESFDGMKLSSEGLNDLLSNILEVDEDNNSLFMTEIFSDPKKLLLAAHRYYNGPKAIETLEAAHKKEKSAAFKRGRASVLDSSKDPKITFGKPKKSKSSSNRQQDSADDDDDAGWDDAFPKD